MAKDDPARAARLAEALRTNLRRRKAQARASDAAGAAAPSHAPGMSNGEAETGPDRPS